MIDPHRLGFKVIVGAVMVAVVLVGTLIGSRLQDERIKGPRPLAPFMLGPRLTARAYYDFGNYTPTGKRLLAWSIVLQILFGAGAILLVV